MDGGPCVWLLPGRGAQQGWEEGGTQLFADCLTQPEAVVDFPSCVQNCQQSQLRGAEFALEKKNKNKTPSSLSKFSHSDNQTDSGRMNTEGNIGGATAANAIHSRQPRQSQAWGESTCGLNNAGHIEGEVMPRARLALSRTHQ